MPRRTRGYASVCSSDGDTVRRISVTEAKKMVSTGEVVEVCRRCERPAKNYCGPHHQLHDTVYLITALYRPIHQSPCSITRSVMEANAGTDGSQAFQRQSRALVAAYPFIGDTLAVRVCPA